MVAMLNLIKNFIKKILPSFLISWYHFLLAFLGATIYRFPGKKLKIIGVTGTNGKSTVVKMITQILEEAGSKVASFSSIRFKIGKEVEENVLKMTMPGRFFLQKLLRKAVDSNCDYVVLEVTSEGIKQHRHRFINFKIAIFTNLSPEHIEAHGSFEKYRRTKEQLFKRTKKLHIINLDDEDAKHFLKHKAEEKYAYSLGVINLYPTLSKNEAPEYKIQAKNYRISVSGIFFKVGNIGFNLNLLGSFNIYNALAAICVGLSQGIDLKTCKKALEKIAVVPGRMETIISEPFSVIVDYAFTPAALEKVYQNLKATSNTRLICVLGAAGGGRDQWKRPILGNLADKYCGEVIVTNEDPYDEDPAKIINQVAEGAGPKAKKILDRREAIRESLKEAQEGDTIVISGKGCESWICVAGGKKIPWDDRKVVEEEARKLAIQFLK